MERKLFSKFKTIFLNLIFSALVGMLLLDIVYLMPTQKTEINASNAIFLFNEEGSHQVNNKKYQVQSVTDDYSDSIILSNCFIRLKDQPFYSAALNGSYLSTVEKDGLYYPLQAYINYFSLDEPFWTVLDYSRYWNGYQVLLIPLLQFFTYPQLRTLNMLLLIVLTTAACICVWRKYSFKHFFAFLCTILSLYPFYLYKTFQTSRIYNLTMLAVIAFCFLKKEKRYLLFLYTGIIIAYLDLFSYPCLAPGILAVLVVTDMKGEKNNLKVIKSLAGYLMLFCIGYLGMWFMKWLLTVLIMGPDVLKAVLNQIMVHTGGEVTFAMGFGNLGFLIKTAFSDYILILFCLTFFWLLVLTIKNGYNKRTMQDAVLYGLMALMPVVLCIIIKGHAFWHPFFDYRNFAIAVFAVFSWIADIPDFKKEYVMPNSTENKEES